MFRAVSRTLWQLKQVPSERKAVKAEAEATGFSPLGRTDYRKVGTRSRDFFILGSGASVLSLSPVDWHAIRNGTSVGLNSWAFHTFVPNVLALEDIHSQDLIPQRRAMLKGLELMSKSARKPLILKFRASRSIASSLRLEIPGALRENCRLYGRFQIPPAAKPRDIRAAIRTGFASNQAGCIPQSLLIDHGASLVRMIHFALRSGAQRIILVGIDLVNSAYFFEEDSTYLSRIGEPPFRRSLAGGSHGTIAARSGSGSIIDFIPELEEVLRAQRGVRLFALNPSEELRGFIPSITF